MKRKRTTLVTRSSEVLCRVTYKPEQPNVLNYLGYSLVGEAG